MLTIENLVKTYAKVRAVDDVSLTMTRGVVGLIGHNGAGKTSLLQMIATLSRPTSGRILFDGVDIAHAPDALRRRLGFLPQEFGVFPNLTARELMEYFAALKGVTDAARIRRCLEIVNLHQHADQQASTFSGGMRRRLGIAQALLNDPDLLILDEPTAGLDPEERMRFRQLITEIGNTKLIIVSTHIVSDIESMASQLAIMQGGRLQAYATPDLIMARARGQIWSAQVAPADYESLRTRVQVLHAQRLAGAVHLRIAHPHQPCEDARVAEPTLEEALMAQHYTRHELAA